MTEGTLTKKATNSRPAEPGPQDTSALQYEAGKPPWRVDSRPHAGWQLLAYTDELTDDLTSVRVGTQLVLIAKDGDQYSTYEGSCPHRGADLALGTRERRDCVTCPFHGRAVHLGSTQGTLRVRQFPTFTLGPMVFARLDDRPDGDTGMRQAMEAATAGKEFATAVNEYIEVPFEFIVENAFDFEHFQTVHRIPRVGTPLTHLNEAGALTVGGDFNVMKNPWVDPRQGLAVERYVGSHHHRAVSKAKYQFLATAFSPGVVMSGLGSDPDAPVIITAGTPEGTGCRVRVVVAAPPGPVLKAATEGSKLAIAQDKVVWESLPDNPQMVLDERDRPIVAYRNFCGDFPRVRDENDR